MFNESYVEKIVNFIISNIELFQLLESLDTLDFFELTATNMQNSNILKRRTNISKTGNDRII